MEYDRILSHRIERESACLGRRINPNGSKDSANRQRERGIDVGEVQPLIIVLGRLQEHVNLRGLLLSRSSGTISTGANTIEVVTPILEDAIVAIESIRADTFQISEVTIGVTSNARGQISKLARNADGSSHGGGQLRSAISTKIGSLIGSLGLEPDNTHTRAPRSVRLETTRTYRENGNFVTNAGTDTSALWQRRQIRSANQEIRN